MLPFLFSVLKTGLFRSTLTLIFSLSTHFSTSAKEEKRFDYHIYQIVATRTSKTVLICYTKRTILVVSYSRKLHDVHTLLDFPHMLQVPYYNVFNC